MSVAWNVRNDDYFRMITLRNVESKWTLYTEMADVATVRRSTPRVERWTF